MIRLDLSYFLRLGANIAALRTLKTGTKMSEIKPSVQNARAWLAALEFDETFGSIGLRNTKAALPKLRDRLDVLLSRPDDTAFIFGDFMALLNDLGSFEVLLTSEFSMADAYYVLEKEPYSTLSLTTKGQTLFPPDTMDKVPEAEIDLHEAGKCLAFEVPTAAAFHIHRATEAVLRRYWEAVTGNAPKPKTRSIGVYLAAMKRLNCGDSKVIAALSQMNELHRNPTIHPEDHLDLQEALALVGIANSVVAAMLKEIPNREEEQPDFDFPPLTDNSPE